MASVFWDAQGILSIGYFEKRRTINSEYYIALLVRLKKEIAKKWPQIKKKKGFFHQDSLYHKSVAVMAKLHELHFELIPHPPNSPDLASRDYWLFADVKRMPQRKRSGSNEEVILETDIFWGQRQILQQKSYQIVKEVLESVHYSRRRLCWWIKLNFAWKLLFY